jgi:integrase
MRGKGEGSLYKNSQGLWTTSIELPPGLDGKRRRKVIRRKVKSEAMKEMQATIAQLRKSGDLSTSSTTVEKWLTYWLDNIVEPNERPKTTAGYRSVVTNHIIPAIGNAKLERVTADHVRKVHARVLGTPKSQAVRKLPASEWPADTVMLSSTYALNAHNVLSAAFKAALAEGKMHSNPCTVAAAPRKTLTEQKALTLDQAVQLLRYLATHERGAQWATYLLTGARRGEIIGLEADRVGDVLDLSWQLQRITDISKAPKDFEHRPLGGTLYLTRPKSRAGWRIVPLVEPLKTILTRHMEAGHGDGLLFTRDDGAPQDPDAVSEDWKTLLAAAGLPSDIVLHGSRHTTVDLLYEAGVPEAVISEIVGHSTRAVTRGYKSKGNHKQLTEAMNLMSELLGRPQKEISH